MGNAAVADGAHQCVAGTANRATRPKQQAVNTNPANEVPAMQSTFAVLHPRLLLAAALTIALGACTQHETRPPSASTTAKPAHVTKAKPAPAKPTPAKAAAAPKATTTTSGAMAAADKNLIDATTGIAECDDYLGNYKACHAVLGTQFTNIDAQLATLRASILDTARDQGVDAAKTKCLALVQQRDEALSGRNCK
jgi:hypothetical protein